MNERVIVGIDTHDDAGVYLLREDLALVQTVDFFTPIVDDPFTFGEVAGANAMSDIYAMGGVPLTALNICAFPSDLDPDAARDILRGGAAKAAEAGVVIIGGHTVEDQELKYGLAVTGTIDPRKIMTNKGAKPGDVLFLTKPIGTGIISTAGKMGMASPEQLQEIISAMKELNRDSSALSLKHGARAMTDVTGFGLIGHALEMARASNVTIEFSYSQVPLFSGVVELAKKGYITGCGRKSKSYYGTLGIVLEGMEDEAVDILYDAQTSGGLLISIPEEKAEGFAGSLSEAGITRAGRVGRVLLKGDANVRVGP